MSKKNKNSIKRNDDKDLGNSVENTAAEVSDVLYDNTKVEEQSEERPAWMPPEGYDPERDADIRYKLKHGKKRRLKKRMRAAKFAGYGSIIGLHKFYLGKPLMGLLLIFLSLISCGVISVIWGIIDYSALAMMGDEEFNAKYNKDKMV